MIPFPVRRSPGLYFHPTNTSGIIMSELTDRLAELDRRTTELRDFL